MNPDLSWYDLEVNFKTNRKTSVDHAEIIPLPKSRKHERLIESYENKTLHR